jgi:hypothetical protein
LIKTSASIFSSSISHLHYFDTTTFLYHGGIWTHDLLYLHPLNDYFAPPPRLVDQPYICTYIVNAEVDLAAWSSGIVSTCHPRRLKLWVVRSNPARMLAVVF